MGLFPCQPLRPITAHSPTMPDPRAAPRTMPWVSLHASRSQLAQSLAACECSVYLGKERPR